MSIETVEIRIRGRAAAVQSVVVEGQRVVCTNRWPRVASITAENLLEGEVVTDPQRFLSEIVDAGLRADIFTFAQKLPNIEPRHKLHMEWDNIAALPITTFREWHEKRVQHDVRSAIKKSSRLGVIVVPKDLDDSLVAGIKNIYDETPIRQGKPFWHYQKTIEQVKCEISTYPERSLFLGAYLDDELIGFTKLVFLATVEAVILQIISRQAHNNKKPTSALIAKAVEICEQRGIKYLTYGSYAYRDTENSLTEFKRRNGFEKILLPRYYIPITVAGRLALKCNLHHQLADWLPKPVLAQIRRARGLWHARGTPVQRRT